MPLSDQDKQRILEEEKERLKKVIQETKCTCSACGNIWYYGKQEESEQKRNIQNNKAKAMACCTGCLPALLIPSKKITDMDKCPKCGSRAVKKELVSHEV